MNQQKGFSLVEVLASLLLVTSLALSLVQQQLQSRQLLNQLVVREQGAHFLDQVYEAQLARVKTLPTIPTPYHLNVNAQKFHLDWSNQRSVLSRSVLHG